MNKKKLAYRWFENGKDKEDVFDKFIYLWISFNALYGSEMDRYEYQRIKSFIDGVYSNKYDIILEGKEFFYTPIVNLHPLHDTSPKNTKRHIDVLQSTQKSNRDKLKALLLCVYQARCNLFHGDKIPERYRDREIANESAKVLIEFLSIYFAPLEATPCPTP